MQSPGPGKAMVGQVATTRVIASRSAAVSQWSYLPFTAICLATFVQRKGSKGCSQLAVSPPALGAVGVGVHAQQVQRVDRHGLPVGYIVLAGTSPAAVAAVTFAWVSGESLTSSARTGLPHVTVRALWSRHEPRP